MRTRSLLLLLVIAAVPLAAHAAEPVTVDPSQELRFERILQVDPDRYAFTFSGERTIEIWLAMPDQDESKDDVSAALVRPGDEQHPVAILDANQASWEPVLRNEAGVTYRQGPSLSAALPAGDYELIVWSSNNDSPYHLDLYAPEKVVPAAETERPVAYRDAYGSPLLFGPEMLATLVTILLALLLAILTQEHEKGAHFAKKPKAAAKKPVRKSVPARRPAARTKKREA